MTAVVRKIIDPRVRGIHANVEPNDSFPEHALEMMRYKSVATTDVEHVSARRKHTRNFKRHVICSTDFASSSCTLEASLDRSG
jgi:hypothetical protein